MSGGTKQQFKQFSITCAEDACLVLGIDWIYGTEHDELFKWRAMATWRKE